MESATAVNVFVMVGPEVTIATPTLSLAREITAAPNAHECLVFYTASQPFEFGKPFVRILLDGLYAFLSQMFKPSLYL